MKSNCTIYIILLLFFSAAFVQCSDSVRITKSLKVIRGSVNGAFIERNGKTLVIYGDPSGTLREADKVLFTHHRRDVVWAGLGVVREGAAAVIPFGAQTYFTSTDSIWESQADKRFHDYYCQSSRILTSSVKISQKVKGEDIINWEGIDVKVLSTGGYTRDAISYIIDMDGKKIAFTGDLIYGNGQLFDLYSLQDSYRGISGYHGYAARSGELIKSLLLLADQKPDIIVPARGPIIYNPLPAIDSLISRIKRMYINYMSVSAYRWYYPGRMTVLSDYVLGTGNDKGWMPYSVVIRDDPPEWYMHIGNSNLVIADDSTAFLIDCGAAGALERIMSQIKSGRIKTIEGIFVTHYHDDHTENINDIKEKFNCPVYITKELKDILENPGYYKMPCLTKKSINNLTVKDNEEKMTWKDFNLTFYYYPGQTIYHDAVLFDKKDGESIFFIGDSFTPSGIDDYCLLNRNLLHEGTGYFYCLDILKRLPGGRLLANQHVKSPFAYSGEQIDFMRSKLTERNIILKELLPWDDINYGIDEQWARAYPYGQKARPGSSVELSVKITNHSSVKKCFRIKPLTDDIVKADNKKGSVTIEPGQEGEVNFKIRVSENAKPGVSVVTFDIDFDDHKLQEWCEAIVEIEE